MMVIVFLMLCVFWAAAVVYGLATILADRHEWEHDEPWTRPRG